MKKFFILLLSLINIQLFSNTLNMKKAVEIAFENKPSLKALKFEIQANKSNEKVAISGYFPKLSLSTQEQFSTGYQEAQNNTILQASQLIFNPSGPIQLQKIAKKGTDMARYKEKSQEDLTRYEVETSFLQTWLLQEKNKLIASLNFAAKQNIKKAENQETQELLGKNDWLKDAAAYADSMANVYFYPDELYNSQNQLEYLLGDRYKQNGDTPRLIWNFKTPIKVKSLTYYYNKAMLNRKELKLKQKEIEQHAQYQNYFENSYLPNVTLSGNSSRAIQVTGRTVSNNIGITLNWNVLDGAANYYESRKSNANKLKAMQEKENYVQQIKYEVQKSFYELIQLKKQLSAKNVELRQAENQYQLAKLKLRIGDISQVDFDTARYNWELAKFSWITVKVGVALKQRELYFNCGYPEVI